MDVVGPARRLEGKVAIVTGACGGIGRAACHALGREGASVVAVDVSHEHAQRLADDLTAAVAGARFVGLGKDVRRESDMHEMAETTRTRFGRIDILVAAAGILRPAGAPRRLVADMPLPEWNEVLDTNLKGVFLSNRSVLPAMLEQKGGQIVNISSVSGRQGRAYDSAYCASKFGVIGLSESLAEEVRLHRVRVHVVLPDAVDTPMWSQNGPIPRPGAMLPAARVAEFVVYLLTMPEDTLLVNPVIAPFQSRRASARPQRAMGDREIGRAN